MKKIRRKKPLESESEDSLPQASHDREQHHGDDNLLVEFSSSQYAFRLVVAGKQARRLTVPQFSKQAHAAFHRFTNKESV